MASLLQTLAGNVDAEFKAVLPALNSVIQDMVANYTAWQSNPVVKATEAAVTLVSPTAALDLQCVAGAAALVQALWEVYGPSTAATGQTAQVIAASSSAEQASVTAQTIAGVTPAASTATPAVQTGLNTDSHM